MSSHTSRCLKIIQEQLQNRSRSHVLDLAKPCNDNLQFLARLNCKIYLADAYNHLNLIQHDQLRELIPKADDTKFDLVLCWDVFNYLDPTQLEILLNYLQNHCNKNALLHFFIRDQAQMPSHPYRFKIFEHNTIQMDMYSDTQINCPRHSLRQLKKLLSEFSSKQGSLLNNGLQEHVWVKNHLEGSRLELLLS